MSLVEKLTKIRENALIIEKKLLDPEINQKDYKKYSKELSDMEVILELSNEYLKTFEEQKKLQNFFDTENDSEMKGIMKEELYEVKSKLEALQKRISLALLPKDKDDDKNVILEIRAGTGGEEAALFAGVLLRMYQKYADSKGWNFEILSISETGIGGIKEASISITGKSVYSFLKFESGVHRVQRVPETESCGRIHTSAATVAILPEAAEVDIELKMDEVRVDIFRSSGPGGQCVNTTDSAVRLLHIPTGIIVVQQDERSQIKNKAKAMKILMAKLYDMEKQKQEKLRSSDRKKQVGSGDRSERIRTYNYPQARITDHRINYTSHQFDKVLEGELSDIINKLMEEDETRRLSEELQTE